MERLTARQGGRAFVKTIKTGYAIAGPYPDANEPAIERLAEYEDTGLTPDDVKRLLSKCRDLEAEVRYVKLEPHECWRSDEEDE